MDLSGTLCLISSQVQLNIVTKLIDLCFFFLPPTSEFSHVHDRCSNDGLHSRNDQH